MIARQFYCAGKTYHLEYKDTGVGPVFFDDACIEYFLLRLLNSQKQFRVRVHAYCITSSSVELLITPETPTGICGFWNALIKQYQRYFRFRFDRASRKFNPRLMSCEIESRESLVAAQRQIEQLPVVAKLVSHAAQYRWTSFSSNGFGLTNPLLHQHPWFKSCLDAAEFTLLQYRDFDADLAVARTSNAR